MSFKNKLSIRAAVRAGIAGVTVLCGCATTGGRTADDGQSACTVFDSLYRHSGFESHITLNGKATIDADQQRLRGKVNLEIDPSGDVVLDFSSSVLFGAAREDFFLSITSDTIRIIDRERGEYYEAENAEQFLAEALGMGFAVREVLGLALGRPPVCGRLDGLRYRAGGDGETRFDGEVDGAAFRVVFAARDRRLESLTWPIELAEGDRDKLLVSYDWQTADDGSTRLEEVVMRLEVNEWRCKITAASI